MNLPDGLFLTGIAALAGAAIPAGALLAMLDGALPRWAEAEFRHTITACGGGVLVAAVALVLVPQGLDRTGTVPAIAAVLAGGVAVMLVDRALGRRGGRFGMFMAMLLDYVPESIAIGALFVHQPQTAVLLALLVAVQNLPEGFAARRELRYAHVSNRHALFVFLMLVPLGPLMALAGWQVLADAPQLLGATLLFSAGGILYLMFQDIAPQVPLKRRWGPPLGAVLGFILGLAGHQVLS